MKRADETNHPCKHFDILDSSINLVCTRNLQHDVHQLQLFLHDYIAVSSLAAGCRSLGPVRPSIFFEGNNRAISSLLCVRPGRGNLPYNSYTHTATYYWRIDIHSLPLNWWSLIMRSLQWSLQGMVETIVAVVEGKY
jgi:hypothetical protein